jgi:23S rRNA (uridine2552-2'-O)-methyltransferase
MNVFDQPVSIGDVLEVSIEEQGSKGDGIAFVDGLVVFVSDASPGEEVQVRIDEVNENCAFAEVWDR